MVMAEKMLTRRSYGILQFPQSQFIKHGRRSPQVPGYIFGKTTGGGSNLHPPSCFRVKSRKVKENIASNKTGETETNSTPQQMAFEH